MDTEPTPAWKEDCPSRLLKGQQHEKTSRPTFGRNIAGGCIRLRSPHDLRIRHPQVMFVWSVGRIYKMDLSGKILGAFGRPGRFAGTIDSIHQIACPDEKTLYVAHTFTARFDKWVAQ